ncbi:MAG: hypothetical protein Q9159_000156 [Coniocarpon cinnabarinum]
MNTVGSVYYGWAFFILCGAGSYYYAKKSINADREQRQREEVARMARQRRELENFERSRIMETGKDEGDKRAEEKSEYEARVPYRSRKGDRFS